MSYIDVIQSAGPRDTKLLELLPRLYTGKILHYLRLRIKMVNLIESVKFNKQCIRRQVIPKYVCIKVQAKANLVQRIKKTGANIWIRQEISNKLKQKEIMNQDLYLAHLELGKCLTPLTFTYVMNFVDQYIWYTSRDVRFRHAKKMERLLEVQQDNLRQQDEIMSPFAFFERVKNLTNIQFTSSEMTILSKGLKYNIEPDFNSTTIKHLIATTKVAMDMASLSVREKNDLTSKIAKLIENEIKNRKHFTKVCQSEHNTLRAINDKLATHNAIMVKADKGNTVVIMNQENYVEKVLDFFTNNNITPIQINPTNRYNAKVKLALKNCNTILSDREKKACIAMNPRTPTLRAQPKIHKDSIPIRPIVNCIDSPTYKLSKKLNTLLTKLYTYNKKYTVKNSRILANAIKDIKIPQSGKFISFDITNLYTNIPVAETIDIIKKNLINYRKVSITEAHEIVNLLELTLSQNYFQFGNKIYKQEDGVAMGNCIAGTIADIFINMLEEKIFNSNWPMLNKIVYYYRYVDDTLLLVNGDQDDIKMIHQKFNSLHPKIKFTIETEQNKTINFLDLTISNHNNHHKFQIYRKPTTTDVIISNKSCHPNSHKHAFFRSMINRLMNLPLDNDAIQQEIQILQYIAQKNDFDPNMVIKMYERYTQPQKQNINAKITLKREELGTRKLKYVPVPYIGKISTKINRLFKKTNIALAFRTVNNIKNKLRSGNEKIPPYLNPGIYKISCNNCTKFYIGQTGRNFTIRYKEHTRDSDSNLSTFYTHLREQNHKAAQIEDAIKILHQLPKGAVMNILEELEIYINTNKQPNDILNEQTEFKHKLYLENFVDLIN